MSETFSPKNEVFNSPLEVALRLLFIFDNTTKSLDLQRLVYYNYILIHSSDIPDAPKSVHADLPRRFGEILVNRKVIQKGLTLLLSKGLIDVKYLKDGISYRGNKQTALFICHFDTEYSRKLAKIADWLSSQFDSMTDKQLSDYMEKNIGKWGSEFLPNRNSLDDVYA